MPDARTADTRAALAATTRSGPGRILIALYAIFSVAATSRSAVQIATRFDAAPIAFLLSAFAALVYIVGTVCLARASVVSRRIATISCVVELVGVVAVSIASYAVPQEFPEPTVWSHFGSGYLFVPVVLPIAALWWLRRTERAGA
ncbi:hypothetical protein R4172_17350 [Rhodococcus kroppenstedtii]|uniref:Integral membrane protein n=1 Tax=Rhodococcoides kroppenstedtii TaxID=293050 RepID=A0A1I0T3R0_9NOCA|nr:hypothetical protein [Rhodococcus kroppenstedtii]MBT1192947.1 hypothetical protein [Rhodococcus kroppenstedtii]MBY6438314.1 hypothetical protein [Rhodococcus kroppenstedtii]MDV7199315.1 hypothetical protein [Rhodococcus kroppenstedtii]SFA46361.1 hypothetical protein SAMN05444374_10416 [Rhodococcus kroppenstedtii]